ncbi:MAG: hypothetical protein SFX73_19545 [Kofleriaceae bacterium]|nr:hypothetical protein [Kofleriaceae bacterium]
MGHRWLLVVALAGCFSSKPVAPTPPPSNVTAAPKPLTRKHSVTVADPLGFLPIDSEMVFHLDMGRLRKSAVWQQYEPKLLEAASLALTQMKNSCGVNPISGLRTIRAGFKDFGNGGKPAGVMVVTGLDGERLLACVASTKSPSAKLAIDGNVVIGTGTDGQPFALELVDASTIVAVVGPNTDRARLDEVVNGGAPLRNSAVFNEIFGTINTQGALWFTVNGNAKAFDGARASGFGFNALFGSVGLVDGLSASVRMRVGSPAAASQMATMITSQVGMAKSFVDRLDISADANDIVFELGMTDAQINAILGMAGLGGGGPSLIPQPTP